MSARNFLNINESKTKEMLLCSLKPERVEPLNVDGVEIQPVSSFKLLDVNIDGDFKWNSHV
jgi:hypothetical protein